MYAVVTTGGRQIKVSQGDIVRVEKIEAPVGDMVDLDNVSLVAKDDGLVVDPAALEKVKVVCEVVRQGLRKKVRVFKKKKRKGYARSQGHRQAYTELKVREIEA
jgi:large subunit ribosomal protein L21